MSRNLRRKLRSNLYLYWSKDASVKERVDHDTMSDILNKLNPKLRFTTNYTKKSSYDDGSWYARIRGNLLTVYFKENEEYKLYTSDIKDNNKNGDEGHTGTKAIQQVDKMFFEKYGVNLKDAFGVCPLDVKLMCSPKQLYYTNSRFTTKQDSTEKSIYLSCVSSVDFSSHYPSNTRGKLPDYKTARMLNGTVKPTEEYPFAMYLKSGHLAEYGAFDTHDWVNHPLFENLFEFEDDYKGERLVQYAHKPLLNPNEDITILMKPSEYELGWLYEELYKKRNDDPIYKLAMNASIGRMACANYIDYRLAHIRAFVIARSNCKMLKEAEKIGLRSIVQLCVDGAIYLGSDIYGEDIKYLGNLHQEYTGVEARFRAMNQYIFKQDGKIIKSKHGGFNRCYDGSDIDNPTCLEDIDKWYKFETNYEKLAKELRNESKKD